MELGEGLKSHRLRGNDRWIVPGLLVLLILVAGCQGDKRKRLQKQEPDASVIKQNSDSLLLTVRYARGFRLERNEDRIILILTDPDMTGKEIARYHLVSSKSRIQAMDGITDICIPIRGLVASSTTHAGFLAALGARDKLLGCNNPERLFDTLLYNRFIHGDLVRTGRDLGYNLEYLIASKPDLVLQSGIDGQFKPDERLTGMGIPVMFALEWMEPTPLGRAEWIKVFGLMTGRARQADSLFSLIERNYLAFAGRGREARQKISVLTGNVFKGTWYMPGGRNYMARFFEDAGMDYKWKDSGQSSSLALSFESVVYQLSDAPVWINVNVDSLSQLLAAEERYSVFRAVKDRRVFSVFNRVNSRGANDFWESAVVRPDLVLADLLAAAHPELMPDHTWNYYKPLVFN